MVVKVLNCMGKLWYLKKELSVFHENCCGFGPPKVKKMGKVRKGNISKSKAKMKKTKGTYFKSKN